MVDSVMDGMADGARPGQPRQLDESLWLLDTLYQGEPGVIASYLLVGRDGLTLIDVGSAATVHQLIHSLTQIGHAPADIRQIVLTHVHLDHAGATGSLLQYAPDARVYVHPAGAAHLSDPSKLVASAARIYGDQMDRLWGTMLPVPADRIVPVEDGTNLTVGEREPSLLTALHTPGHASHHIAFHDVRRQAVFAGDVAGVALEGCDYVRPPTPPPDLDLEAWRLSIARLRQLAPHKLYLPHFGSITRVTAHLSELEARLSSWGEFVLAGLRAGQDTGQMADALERQSEPEVRRVVSQTLNQVAGEDPATVLRRYELATNYRMTVAGYERYWRKRHPEGLGSSYSQ